MFIAALFTIAKIWKQLKCPLIDELIKKKFFFRHTHIHTYNGILCNHKKECRVVICENLGGPRGYYAK